MSDKPENTDDNGVSGGVAPDTVDELPSELGILPLRGVVVFPSMLIPLIVSRPKTIKLIDDCLANDLPMVMLAQKDVEIEDPGPDDLHKIGTAGKVIKMLRLPDNTIRIMAQGLHRVSVEEVTSTEPFLKARVSMITEPLDKSVELKALMKNVAKQFSDFVSQVPYLTDELQIVAINMESPGMLADMVAGNLNISLQERQEVLELSEPMDRLKKVSTILSRELDLAAIGSKIQKDLQKEMGKGQREYYLRQQLKAIQRELGEGDEETVEIEELRQQILEAKMPEDVFKVAEKELSRLEKMNPSAAEYTVSRTYIDWLVTLPWSVSTEDSLDIPEARKILDEDHHDLDKVKDRMLEFMAVRKLKNDTKGPILCFVGPPGVGKTSLGRSIARSMGRKFYRMSLGGVRDEAEIRGHRRTYVGALPGRILQGIKKTGSNNPLFMLDEIDKVGADFRGDPTSALLEVLDPEQNFSFSDHYLEVEFDLSKVLFIATANVLDTIPAPLRDRMEVIELPGYIEEDKLKIAKQYLVPRQKEANGIKDEHIKFEDDALRKIIRDYTREAGVRNLEREIGTVCRKVARAVTEGKKKQAVITAETAPDYLGPQKFMYDVAERTSVAGVATGLAWTPAGGDILFIESTKMRGGKQLTLTGSLGDVMKESAQAALSVVRSRAVSLGIDEDFYSKNDIHLHVPAGAIPKDGPSAGVTMAVSIASLLTGRPIRSDVAMTGEITLRGKVLPVGGIKEKVLAAIRAGISTVLLPKKNEKDLVDVPPEVKEKMKFIFLDDFNDALEHALVDGAKSLVKT